MPEATVVCVLGMHRSGTSLVMRMLNLLGVYLGPEEHLMKPAEINPGGFWEHQLLTDLNDEILSCFGGSWYEPPTFPAGWERDSRLADLRQRAREVIREDFGKADLWGWKDPRTCLTLPFWRRLLPPVRYVLCLRNPVSVASSIDRSFSSEIGANTYGPLRHEDVHEFGRQVYGLWVAYVRASLDQTAGEPRLVVFYEDVMDRPQEELQRLSRFLGRPQVAKQEEVRGALTEAAIEELWHHRASLVDSMDEPRLEFPAKALYLALRLYRDTRQGARADASGGHASREALESFASSSEETQAGLARMRAEASERESQLAERDEALAAARANVASRDTAIEELRSRLYEREAHRRELAEMRQAADERAELEQLVRELTEANEAAQRELAQLRQVAAEKQELERALEEERRRAAALAAHAELLSGRATELRELLLDAHDQLVRRDEQIESLAAGALEARPTGQTPGGEAANYLTYKRLVNRVREIVRNTIPPDATVIVISKGDEELLKLDGRRAWHFPRAESGTYAGHYPATGADAISHLEALRAKGGQFLVIPGTALWWLDHYADFGKHLASRYATVFREDDVCSILSLGEQQPGPGDTAHTAPSRELYAELVSRVRELVQRNVPSEATVLVVSKGDEELLELDGGRRAWHFPQGEDGRYADYYPATSADAIAHLEELRARGGEYVVFPSTASWWLDHYGELREHLESRYEAVVGENDVGVIFRLRDGPVANDGTSPRLRRLLRRLWPSR